MSPALTDSQCIHEFKSAGNQMGGEAVLYGSVCSFLLSPFLPIQYYNTSPNSRTR